jgi:HSP20 family protein
MASNLTRFDPFSDIARMNPLRALDELFRDLSPATALRGAPLDQTISVDVSETDDTYTVRAEIPGVKKEDIKVDVRGNRVSIAAETHRESEQKEGSRVIRSELYHGQVQRSFALEQDIDDAKAEAKYVDGVLELTLPKKTAGGGSKLEIH